MDTTPLEHHEMLVLSTSAIPQDRIELESQILICSLLGPGEWEIWSPRMSGKWKE